MLFKLIVVGMFLEASIASNNLIILGSYHVLHKYILLKLNVSPTHLSKSCISQLLKNTLMASGVER